MGETRERHKKKDGKQPLASSRQPVPQWERDFCTVEHSIPWKKIRQAKLMLQVYDNIANWDDSEARKAFETAKARYFAKRFGKPCDALTDTKPVEDLDKISDEEEQTEMNCTLESFLLDHYGPTSPIQIIWGIPESPVSSIEIKARPVPEANAFGHCTCIARKTNHGCCNGSTQQDRRRRRCCRRGDTIRKNSQQMIKCLDLCRFWWQKKNK
ncbi:uncharacterized protein [Typha angustifolia]|uniref:uncharacterized protein n=1 Tax=Typha angustifolia TaxID=59011 RepID=UPI003C2AF380